MNKDKRQLLLKVGFIALVGVMVIVGASYGSGLLFFNLNKMPLGQVHSLLRHRLRSRPVYLGGGRSDRVTARQTPKTLLAW